MKTSITIVIATLCSLAVFGQTKTAEDSPNWPDQIVQRAFNEVSAGLRTSWSERYLARLGDRAAPEILSRVSGKPLTKQDADTALTLVKMSFADTRSIRHEQDKAPTNTLALLDYLNKQTSDADVKSKIGSMRDQLKPKVQGVQP